jgi:hypothetical protein
MSYKIVQLDRQQTLFQQSVKLDTSRITAILIRQSRRGSDKAHIESRMLQESLIPFVMAAREEDDLEHIHIFDEGSGISGTKGIDKRNKLRELHVEIASNLIGDIVLARPDRLFRDKHFANVSTFTQLAEKMKVKVIVPSDKGVIVYDFTKEKDLQAFQEAMIQAYAYIVNQIGYMNRARAFKVSKGFYGGGNIALPYVLLRDMPKVVQVQVIYEPWREAAIDLFKKFTHFSFETGRIARYVEDMPYIFGFMPPHDLEQYMAVTTMTKVHGGYKFTRIETLMYYLSNLTLAGFAHGGRDKETGDTILIPNAFEAAVPIDLLEPCFAAITGEHLDGTPYLKNGGSRQFRRTDIEIDAILHGLLTSDDGTLNVFGNHADDYPIYDCRKGGYFGQKNKVGIGRVESEWALPARPVDKIILDRLISLAEYDDKLVERVKEFYAEAAKEGTHSLVVLDTAIKNTLEAIQRVGRTIVKVTKGLVDEQGNPIELDENDPLIVERRDLQVQLRRLQKQRDDAARQSKEDPSNSISNFYHVLSHLRTEFQKQPPQTKKDMMKKLIEEVKITSISPHLFTLHITWIRPLATERDDVALLWRAMPTKSDITNIWTDEEEEALRTLYPTHPLSKLMQAIPNKSRGQMKDRAYQLGIKRDYWHIKDQGERFYWTVSYIDLQAITQFAQSTEEQAFLWSQINSMAKNTKRPDITPLWMFPVDMVSFSQSQCVTDILEEGLSGQALRERRRLVRQSW